MGIQREKKLLAEIVVLISRLNPLKNQEYAEKYKKEQERLKKLEKQEKDERLETIRHIIAERVRDTRKRSGLSQEKFAERSSVTAQTISRIEQETTLTSADTIIKIAKAFSVSADYLLGLTDYKEMLSSSNAYKQLEEAQLQLDQQGQLIKELHRELEKLKNDPRWEKRVIILKRIEKKDCPD